MRRILTCLLVLGLAASLFSGCDQPSVPLETEGTTPTRQAAPAPADFSKTDEDMFTERDMETEYAADSAVTIRLQGETASATSDSVKISGATVTITEEATYRITGSLEGMLVVNAPDTAKLQLVFDGAHIRSATSAALYILAADKVFVTLAGGSENSLQNGGSFTPIDDSNIDGAIFSRQDLTLNGSGSLTVTSPAGHGIVCKDDLVITGGSYTVSAASHGLDANDSVRIRDAALTVDAGKDAIHAENTDDATLGFVYMASGTVVAAAEGDGIAAGSWMQIADGTFDLLTGGGSENGSKERSDAFGGFMGGGKPGGRPGGNMGGRPGTGMQPAQMTTETDGTSMKGLKAAGSLLISGGSFTLNSADDAIHADGSVIINGGSFAIATGDDAIHAEDTLTVTAGTVAVSCAYEGLEALHIVITGGDIQAVCTDDGLNAAGGVDQSGTTGGRDGMFGGGRGGPGGMSGNSDGSIVISGGTLNIQSSGDGIDANGTLEISGGYTTVTGPTQGDTATLDYDVSAVITGGTFIGTGASGMAQSFSGSEQGVVAIRAGNQPAGTRILLTDGKGNTLISHTPEMDFGVVILSSDQLVCYRYGYNDAGQYQTTRYRIDILFNLLYSVHYNWCYTATDISFFRKEQIDSCIHNIKPNNFFYQVFLKKQVCKSDSKQNHCNLFSDIEKEVSTKHILKSSLFKQRIKSVHRTCNYKSYTNIKRQNQTRADNVTCRS